jgi:hypothetical protein
VIATAPTDVRVAFSCVEEEEIPDLFEEMYRCAMEMMAAPAQGISIPDSAFEE